MSIESEPGGGTTVTISLPVDGPAGRKSDEPAALMALPANTSREKSDATLRKSA
jgi:cell cycle sensor histidine kinase DivJ